MRNIILLLTLTVAGTANAQFFQGFLQGLQQGVQNTMQNALQQQARQSNTPTLRTLNVENGFTWYQTVQNYCSGAEDQYHNVLIPFDRGYSLVIFTEVEDHIGFFTVWRGDSQGACDLTGREIVPPTYSFVMYDENGFEYQSPSGDYVPVGWFLDANGMATRTNTNKVKSVEETQPLIVGSSTSGSTSAAKTYGDMSVDELRARAEKGDPHAAALLGAECDKAKNYTEAVKWFRPAAEQGISLAQFGLGCCYYEGNGVEQDYQEAAKWLLKSYAQNKNASTLFFLLGCKSHGVEIDLESLGKK